MKRIAFVLLLMVTGSFLAVAPAQELLCNVQVTAQRIQGSNRQVFETMQREIYEFMNNTNWTNHIYSYSERIDCNILINLTEQLSADEFKGTIQVQLRRPVFNTTYNTTVLNFIDNQVQFRYVEYEPLEFDPNTHRSNLTSLLGYYAYLILGFDYDTFSPAGGTEFFTIAEKIVNNAQSEPTPGWKPFDGSRNRNRYWLINNILDDQYKWVRTFVYDYHIKGLDYMESRINESRASIVESLRLLLQVSRSRPDPFMYYMQIVMEAKTDEIINIYSKAFPEEKSRVVQILNEIDPANKSKYDKIITITN